MSATLFVLATDPAPIPYLVAMGLGFVIGAAGHVYKSALVVSLGIAVIGITTALFIGATNPSLGG
ncbi:MAG: hypothetical protein ACR2ND_00775 [Solirubrobacteraceae bacterium]